MADRHPDHRRSGLAYAWLFFGTIAKRRVKHIYVANWFYGAFIIAVALLHIVNNLAIPVGRPSPTRSTAARSMRWCSGGTATTRSASS
jgi:cytochrome c oxidase cbb3-type subunit I